MDVQQLCVCIVVFARLHMSQYLAPGRWLPAADLKKTASQKQDAYCIVVKNGSAKHGLRQLFRSSVVIQSTFLEQFESIFRTNVAIYDDVHA